MQNIGVNSIYICRQTSSISYTKSKNLNVSRLVLQLSLPNPLMPGILSREWRCSWSNADRRCSNYILVINNFIAYLGATYIRGLTVAIRYSWWIVWSYTGWKSNAVRCLNSCSWWHHSLAINRTCASSCKYPSIVMSRSLGISSPSESAMKRKTKDIMENR